MHFNQESVLLIQRTKERTSLLKVNLHQIEVEEDSEAEEEAQEEAEAEEGATTTMKEVIDILINHIFSVIIVEDMDTMSLNVGLKDLK